MDADAPPPVESSPFALHALYQGLVGHSAAMRAVFRKIELYAPTDAPVLVTGETGTGKELIARALHRASLRRAKPFVALNCSALNDELFESELFGHERGAFTGAVSAHRGRFERAGLGTLFLDEVGDMPLRSQAKLLRVLEHGTFERVGGEREMAADVRIVAATNVGLERAVAGGRFREDLYHRVAVLRIHAPALRERLDDLPLLVDHFLRVFAERYGRRAVRLSPEALNALAAYAWPGNVRELRNVLERLYVEATGDVVARSALAEWEQERELLAAGAWNVDLRDAEHAGGRRVLVPADHGGGELERAAVALLRAAGAAGGSLPAPRRLGGPSDADDDDGMPVLRVAAEVRGASDAPPVEELTEETLRAAFRAERGRLAAVARRLGMHRSTLYRHMQRLGLDRADLEGAS